MDLSATRTVSHFSEAPAGSLLLITESFGGRVMSLLALRTVEEMKGGHEAPGLLWLFPAQDGAIGPPGLPFSTLDCKADALDLGTDWRVEVDADCLARQDDAWPAALIRLGTRSFLRMAENDGFIEIPSGLYLPSLPRSEGPRIRFTSFRLLIACPYAPGGYEALLPWGQRPPGED